ncbi:hypothetical protein OSB04_023448 [Centaurea solstitialis]|uniref:Uncharacterized protein n=1 Tax=Centaurea solstitialis TaxID=347529 RepID=A0AA38WCX4_9ASTR|nr:hypothetical protein OSB04_023448 [Centaurea solstitialis]
MNPSVPLANINARDINARVGVLIRCQEKGHEVSIKPSPSIYMVPGSLRDLSPSSFKPRVVSIGPLHREDKLLQDFEEQKTAYLYLLLARLLDHLDLSSRQILEVCLHKVDASIDGIRACYVGMNRYTDSQLVEMMVMR